MEGVTHTNAGLAAVTSVPLALSGTNSIHESYNSRVAVLPKTLKTYRLKNVWVSLPCGDRSEYCLNQPNSQPSARLHIQWLTSLRRLETFGERGIRDVECFGCVKPPSICRHECLADCILSRAHWGRSRNCRADLGTAGFGGAVL